MQLPHALLCRAKSLLEDADNIFSDEDATPPAPRDDDADPPERASTPPIDLHGSGLEAGPGPSSGTGGAERMDVADEERRQRLRKVHTDQCCDLGSRESIEKKITVLAFMREAELLQRCITRVLLQQSKSKPNRHTSGHFVGTEAQL